MHLSETDAFVIDTHPLVWYMLEQNAKLSEVALGVLRDAEEGRLDIIVPAIVVAETVYVVEKEGLPFKAEKIVEGIRSASGFIIRPLDVGVLEEMARIEHRMEMHDRIIAATARVYGATVLSKDRAFEGVVRSLWEKW